MNTAEQLGRKYAAETYALLKKTDDVRFRGWGEGYRPVQLDNLGNEVRRALEAAHERAEAADICVRQYARTIADLPVGCQADALRAMCTQFDRNLRADLADTVRRYRDRFPGCDHVCDEHRPYGLSIDAEIQPVSAQGIRRIHTWYEEREPAYVGDSVGFEISGGVWVLNSIAGELRDGPDGAAVTASGSRQSLAEALVYIENTLVQVEGCGIVIATYDNTQAAKALMGFRAKIEKEFGRRAHAAKHALATDPLAPCDYPGCGPRPKGPWS